MKNTQNLTEGKILPSLLRFAVPVLFTLFLQALYGGVDLLVVGQFGSTDTTPAAYTICSRCTSHWWRRFIQLMTA